MIEEIGELVQIEYNGAWEQIELDQDEIEYIAEERTEKIYWLS